MMVDPDNDFMTLEELADYDVIEEIIDIFDENDNNIYFHFDDSDVNEWYDMYGDGYTKEEFYTMVKSCIVYYEWYNKSKYGFDVYTRPTK